MYVLLVNFVDSVFAFFCHKVTPQDLHRNMNERHMDVFRYLHIIYRCVDMDVGVIC